MESAKVNQILALISSKVPSVSIPSIREQLLKSEFQEADVMMIVGQMKDPTIALVISLLLGVIGIDRFYIGDTGLGVGKLLTCGGGGIWTIIDWFLIMNATKQKNLELLLLHVR